MAKDILVVAPSSPKALFFFATQQSCYERYFLMDARFRVVGCLREDMRVILLQTLENLHHAHFFHYPLSITHQR